ncbi:MAG: bifunctional phosphoribosylaminoimidazolecarboxamide formyltransferase/IMP cyclohydrolase [Bacteroidales bacterium]|nr:bifunctional phosphoribosylaminoimidazolecarboxamide formyltransferase/IMP cyclohydrolase [Bacteroidales bacterium]
MKAIFSVSHKEGVVEFATALAELGWEIVATGGTMRLLQESGLRVTNISELTGFPEICDGRVKTLHPKVHGGILGRRDLESHREQLKENGIEYIDLVCVNLYPFSETIANPAATFEDAIENIDIGGPSMLRSAAKNWKDVTVVCRPEDYDCVLAEIREHGNTLPETRLRLSAEAYTHTAEYDMAIAGYMRSRAGLPEKLLLSYDLRQGLRYGENPHQKADFFVAGGSAKIPYSLATAEQLNGKELSYNNIQDANAALNMVREFDVPFCVGVKHTNPCGAAVGADALDAWTKAYEADKVSIFGGIVAMNREVDAEVAAALKPIFLEIVMAPSYSPEALKILCSKKNLRVLKVDMEEDEAVRKQYVAVNGGMLVQEQDCSKEEIRPEMCVTQTAPNAGQMGDLEFAWRLVKHVKSNAIVVVKNGATLGVGAGQMNRIGSAEIALKQAAQACEDRGESLAAAGPVLASDGFFPFDDCVTLAAEYGVAAIIQPGGSIRDEDSIVKANEAGIPMLFTGVRHFKH